MNRILIIIATISFIGISYYTIWVVILVVNSIKDNKCNYNFSKIDPELSLFVLMPMLNEVNVVNHTLCQFMKSTKNLPQVKLGVIDDASNDGTGELIQKFINKYHCENKIYLIKRTFPNAQSGKGDSLNWGLNYIRNNFGVDVSKTIIGVLDADALMKQIDFMKVLVHFSQDDALSLLQTKVRMLNINNWLQRMQDIEFVTVNDWIQRVRNKINNAAASGNGQFIHMKALDSVNPWGNALLEDFEFSTKFLLSGKKTVYCSDITVYQEAVDKIKPFIRQRSRWVQGGLDCVSVYFKPILCSSSLKPSAKFEMIFFMFLPILTLIVGLANFIMLFVALFYIYIYLWLILFLIIINFFLASYMAFKYCSDNDSSNKISLKIIWTCGGMVIYNIILFPAILIAFYRKLKGNQTWIKTTHGG